MPILCVCSNTKCQKSFFLPPSRVKDGRGIFCSKACQYSKNPEERFWEKVQKTDTCWLWTAFRDEKGYGRFGAETGKIIGAHKYSYLLHYGPIRGRLFVCHNCPGGDNPACVNPSHLWLGTHQENITDAVHKGRTKYPARSTRQLGEKNAKAKLTTTQVIAIRRLRGQASSVAVGKLFNCTEDNIQAIWLRKSWNHLPEEEVPCFS